MEWDKTSHENAYHSERSFLIVPSEDDLEHDKGIQNQDSAAMGPPAKEL